MTSVPADVITQSSLIETVSLSIVVCTYNRAASLGRTLHSLDAVRVPPGLPVDLVVVNNNSSDETPRVCQAFAATARLPTTCCDEPRQGLSNARNRGLEMARGQVVIFTDDDVTVPGDWIERYADTYRRYQADAVFGRIVPEWGGLRPVWYHRRFSAIYGTLDYGRNELVVTSRRHEFFGANFSIRRSLLKDIGGFDPRLGRTPDGLYISEERQIFLNLVEQRRSIVYNPEILVHHHISEAMKTREYIRKYYRDTAVSLVNVSPGNPRRRFLGIPYFRIVDCLRSLLLFLPRTMSALIHRESNAFFPLRLELGRSVRVCLIHLQRRWTRSVSDA